MSKLNYVPSEMYPSNLKASFTIGKRARVSIHKKSQEYMDRTDTMHKGVWVVIKTLSKDGEWKEMFYNRRFDTEDEMKNYLDSEAFKEDVKKNIEANDKNYQELLDMKKAYSLFQKDIENFHIELQELLKKYPKLQTSFGNQTNEYGDEYLCDYPFKELRIEFNYQNYIGEKA